MARKGKLAVWKQLERSKIFKTKEARPTKIGVHALNINPYLHKFLETILFDFIFDIHGKGVRVLRDYSKA